MYQYIPVLSPHQRPQNHLLLCLQPASGSVILMAVLKGGDKFAFASQVVARGRPLEPSRLRMPSLSTGATVVLLRSMMQCGDVDIA